MLFLKVSPESVLVLAFEKQTKPASVHAAKGIRRRKDISGFFCKTAFYFSFKTLLVVFVFLVVATPVCYQSYKCLDHWNGIWAWKEKKRKNGSSIFLSPQQTTVAQFFFKPEFFFGPMFRRLLLGRTNIGSKKIRRKKIFFSDDEKEKIFVQKKTKHIFFVKTVKLRKFIFHCSHRLLNFFLQKNGDGAFLDWILTSLTVINGRRTVTKNYNYNYRIEKSWFKKAVWKNRFPEESFRSGSTSCPWPSSCWTCSWWRQPCRRLRCSRGCRYRLKKIK